MRPLRAAALVLAVALPAGAQDAPPPAAPEFKPPAILAARREGVAEPEARAAVEAGLDWLRRHRKAAGGWACRDFGAACQGAKCDGEGWSSHDVGATGLAVLAFLGAGRTPPDGADADVVRAALGALTAVQDGDGCFGPRHDGHFLYDHLAATTAVAEALWLTGDPALVEPTRKACKFVHDAANPYLAWRYASRGDGDNDTPTTAWSVVALRTCPFAEAHAGVPSTVDRAKYKDALGWFQRMTDGARVGYQTRGGPDSRLLVPTPDEPKPPPPTKPGQVPELRRIETYTVAPGVGVYLNDARFATTYGSSCTAEAGCAMALAGDGAAVSFVEGCAGYLRDHPTPAHERFLDLHSLLFGGLLDVQRPLDAPKPKAGKKEAWSSWRAPAVEKLVAAQRAKADGCAAGSWDPWLDPYGAVGGRVYSTAMAVLALQAPTRFPKVWDPKAKLSKPGKK
jgi:hypothetical protein